MIEECEGEDDATLAVDGNEAAVANACHRADQRGFELLAAAEPRAERALRRRLRSSGHDAVFVAQAIVGKGIIAIPVIALDRLEIGIADCDQFGARVAFGLGNSLHIALPRTAERLDHIASIADNTRIRFSAAKRPIGPCGDLFDFADLAIDIEPQPERYADSFRVALRAGGRA